MAGRTTTGEEGVPSAGRGSGRRRELNGRRVVVVSGSPGAGKSTLAVPLAATLGLPLLTKDTIKETLFDVLGHGDDDPLVSSRRLGAAAMTLLWRLAEDCPAVMIEANFRSASELERARLAALCDRPVEVYCRVPPATASARYAARATAPGHHPVHVIGELPVEAMAEYQEPFHLGPVIEVDTTRPVDVEAVADRVLAELAAGEGLRREAG